jgi:hypothetical protein
MANIGVNSPLDPNSGSGQARCKRIVVARTHERVFDAARQKSQRIADRSKPDRLSGREIGKILGNKLSEADFTY